GGRPGGALRAGGVRGVPGRLLGVRVEREVGQAPRGPRDVDPLGPRVADRARPRRAAPRRPSTRGDARLRLGGVALHAVRLELEYERLDPAGPAHLGLLLRDVAGGARRLHAPLALADRPPPAPPS